MENISLLSKMFSNVVDGVQIAVELFLSVFFPFSIFDKKNVVEILSCAPPDTRRAIMTSPIGA